MKIRYSYFFIINFISLFLGNFTKVEAQEINLYIDQASITQDAEDETLFRVPVGVTNFNEVFALDFEIQAQDPMGRIDTSFNDIGLLNGLSNAFEVDQENNRLIVVWIDLGGQFTGVTLSDSTILFEFFLRAEGAPGACFPLDFTFLEAVVVGNILEPASSVGIGGEVCIPAFISLEGSVRYPDDDDTPLANVQVEVALNNGMIFIDTTDNQGRYNFPELPIGEDLLIRAVQKLNETTTTERRRGINVGDVVAIQDHRLQRQPFTSPYQFIAADVDQSSRVGIVDAVQIRAFILTRIEAFPLTPSWRFVAQDFVFPDGVDPLRSGFSNVIRLAAVQEDQSAINFIGIKSGDVNFSAF